MTVGGAEGKKAPALFDAHCHLDWEADPAAVARACGQRGVALACCTVTPQAFLAARGALAAAPNVVLGVGAHPWWVADSRVGQADVDLAAELAAEAPLVGEVGLDFNPARSNAAGNEAQVRALTRICVAAPGARGPEGHLPSRRALRRRLPGRPGGDGCRRPLPLRHALVQRQLRRARPRPALGLLLLRGRADAGHQARPRVRPPAAGSPPVAGDRPSQRSRPGRGGRGASRLPRPGAHGAGAGQGCRQGRACRNACRQRAGACGRRLHPCGVGEGFLRRPRSGAW